MKAIEDLKDLAIRAHQGTSFSPEDRGVRMVREYSNDLTLLLADIPEEHRDWVSEKYVKLLSAWWYSKSRCISSSIVGPSNFPTRRAQKFKNWEQGHFDTFYNWSTTIAGKLKRKAARANWTLEGDIHRLNNELEFLKACQERMKAANKILHSKRLSADEKLEEIQNIGFHDLHTLEGFGFESWQLTNNLSMIKGREARILVLQKRIEAQASTPKESIIGGVRVVEDVAENRLKLFFESIPPPAARAVLKSNGFRWSGKNKCWQAYFSVKSKLSRVLDEVSKF